MAHLLRCYAQINPQRIKDTPAVNLCSRLVSAPSIFKSAGGRGSHGIRATENSSQRSSTPRMAVVLSQERACGCFLYVTSIFRTDRDVREIEQQRVCGTNSTLNSVRGSTLFNRLFAKSLRKVACQKRWLGWTSALSHRQNNTSMYRESLKKTRF